MVEDATILYDDDGFFSNILGRLRERLRALGAKRGKAGIGASSRIIVPMRFLS